MDKNKIILIAIVILVIVLAALTLVINNSKTNSLNATEENITEDVANITNVTVETDNATSSDGAKPDVNTSVADKKVDNKSLEDTGWKWSEQEQCYIHQFVDADGDLHVQTATIDGIRDLEFKSDGTVYKDGKDVTERYYRDFN